MENLNSNMPPCVSLCDRASARNVVLRIESLDAFEQFRDAYFADLRPVGISEHGLVEQIVMCNWRLRRIWIAQTAALDAQAQVNLKKIGADGTPTDLLGLTVLELAGAGNMKALLYQEASLNRQLRAVEKQLAQKQHQRRSEPLPQPQKPRTLNANPRPPEPPEPVQLPSPQQDTPVTPAPPGRAA